MQSGLQLYEKSCYIIHVSYANLLFCFLEMNCATQCTNMHTFVFIFGGEKRQKLFKNNTLITS